MKECRRVLAGPALTGVRVPERRREGLGAVRFSLIMATVGRTQEFGSFLASLSAQTYKDFELVVVDQNPDDRLVPILAPYEGSFAVSHLRCKPGVSRARNVGLRHAGGDLLAFPDDDCRYPPDLLAGVARFFAEHPEKDGLTGRSVNESGETSTKPFDAEAGPVDRLSVWTRSIEFTIFVRQESTEGLWFDEELGPGADTPWGSGEGTDYLLQFVEGGASFHYDPAVVVVHPSRAPSFDEPARRRARSYGRGSSRVIRKHRMPLGFKARRLIGPLRNAVWAFLRLEFPQARFRWNIFVGRLRGLLPP